MKRPCVQLTCCPLMYGCMSPHFCCCRTWGKYLMQYWLFSFSLNIYFVLLFPKLCKTALIGRGGWVFSFPFSLLFFFHCLFIFFVGFVFACLFDGVFLDFLLPNTLLRCFGLIEHLEGDAQKCSKSHRIV